MTRKHCPQCGQNKPLGEFHHNRARADRHEQICKVCRLARNVAYRAGKSSVRAILSEFAQTLRRPKGISQTQDKVGYSAL